MTFFDDLCSVHGLSNGFVMCWYCFAWFWVMTLHVLAMAEYTNARFVCCVVLVLFNVLIMDLLYVWVWLWVWLRLVQQTAVVIVCVGAHTQTTHTHCMIGAT